VVACLAVAVRMFMAVRVLMAMGMLMPVVVTLMIIVVCGCTPRPRQLPHGQSPDEHQQKDRDPPDENGDEEHGHEDAAEHPRLVHEHGDQPQGAAEQDGEELVEEIRAFGIAVSV
jgi:hypothetical protein